MRTFFILVLFFLVFLLVAAHSIAGVDLTSDTAAAVPIPVTAVSAPTSSEPVIQIQENHIPLNQSTVFLPVTSGCSDPYTVRAGDTLSQIAVNCNTTLAFLTQITRK